MLTYTVNHEEPAQAATRALLSSVPSITVTARKLSTGETLWEFDIEQRDYEQRTGLEPAIDLGLPPVQTTWAVVSCDAYAAFAEMPEFFAWLAAHPPVSLEQVRVYLDSAGVIDVTKRTPA